MREKLIELIGKTDIQMIKLDGPHIPMNERFSALFIGEIADHLIANGVTFAKDTNVLTNADRIRAMTNEELADWIARTQIANVTEALEVVGIPWDQKPEMKEEVAKESLEWLKQPVQESNNA